MFSRRGNGGAVHGAVDRCWVVDPIDGTHTLRGVPYWNVAIGYVENGRTEIGLSTILLPTPTRAARPRRGAVDLMAGFASNAETQALAGSYVRWPP